MRYRHVLKTAFLQKKYIKWLWNPTTDFSLTSANKPQSSLVIYLQIWSQSWPYNSLHKIGDNSLNKKQKRLANFILNVIDSLTMPYTSLISTWDWFALFEIKTCRKIRELFFHRLYCYSQPVTSGSLREFFLEVLRSHESGQDCVTLFNIIRNYGEAFSTF